MPGHAQSPLSTVQKDGRGLPIATHAAMPGERAAEGYIRWNEDETYVTTTLDLRVARPRGGAVVRRDGVAGGGTGGGRVGRGSALLMGIEVAGSEMMEIACEGLKGVWICGQHSMAVECLREEVAMTASLDLGQTMISHKLPCHSGIFVVLH